jgi:putative ABC transport system substrate-binding protein
VRAPVTHARTGPSRGVVLGALLALLLAAPCKAAEPSPSPVGIGYLSGGSDASDRTWRRAFVDGLRELGWISGQNVLVHERYADGRFERLPRLAAELIGLRVSVIVTVTTPAAQAAKRATTTVPIVIAAAGDVLGSGLVPSIARPGGNVTGLSFLGTELVVKQMDLLLELLPRAARLAFMGDPRVAPEAAMFRELETAGRSRNVDVRFIEERDVTDYESAFARVAREGIAGLIVAANVRNHEHRRRIVALAAHHRVPAVYAWREGPEDGGLISYGDNRPLRYRRAAAYVDRILKGARPGDLPVEQPTTFELVANLRTAQALGLTLPPALLLRADDVIR